MKTIVLFSLLLIANIFSQSVALAQNNAEIDKSSTTSSQNRNDSTLIKIWVPKKIIPLSTNENLEQNSTALDIKEKAILGSILGKKEITEVPFNCVKSFERECIEVCDAWPMKCRQICYRFPVITCI